MSRLRRATTAIVERDVIDDGDEPSLNSRTPAKGMLLHEQSVMHAHVQSLADCFSVRQRFLLSGPRAWIESGLYGGAVDPRFSIGIADAFYVKVTKDGTVDQKRGLVGKSIKAFRRMCEMHRTSPKRKRAADDSRRNGTRANSASGMTGGWCTRLVTCVAHQDDLLAHGH